MRKLLEYKLHSRNIIKGINLWAVPLIKYPRPFSKWTREEFQQMNQRIRKRMTTHICPQDHVENSMCQEKKVEEDSLELVIVSMPCYDD